MEHNALLDPAYREVWVYAIYIDAISIIHGSAVTL